MYIRFREFMMLFYPVLNASQLSSCIVYKIKVKFKEYILSFEASRLSIYTPDPWLDNDKDKDGVLA